MKIIRDGSPTKQEEMFKCLEQVCVSHNVSLPAVAQYCLIYFSLVNPTVCKMRAIIEMHITGTANISKPPVTTYDSFQKFKRCKQQGFGGQRERVWEKAELVSWAVWVNLIGTG